ncbi:stalk domain-containing protein [Anaerotignum sp.]
MKKHSVFACTLCASILLGMTAYAEEPMTIESPNYQADALVQEDTAFIPLRQAADALGCTVTWDKAARSALLANEMRQMGIEEGQELYTSAPAQEGMVGMPAPQKMGAAFIDETGRLFVPAEVFSILIGYDVTVDGGSVTIVPQK